MTDAMPLVAAFAATRPVEAARALEEYPADDGAALLAALEPDVCGVALAAMTPNHGAACALLMPHDAAVAALRAMPPRAAAALLRSIDPDTRGALLKGLPRTRQLQIGLVLHQPRQTVGAWMDSAAPSVRINSRAATVRRNLAGEPVVPSALFVTDVDRRFVGAVRVAAVLAADDDTRMDTLYQRGGPTIRANDAIDAAMADPVWRDHDELPVVDHAGLLVGAIRYSALRRATAERAETDRSFERPPTGSVIDLVDWCYIRMADAIDATLARRRVEPPGGREDAS